MNAVQCNGNGTATLSWGSVSGATSYPVRYRASTLSSCPGGWFSANPGECDLDNNSATSITVPVAYGTTYDWWVHAYSTSGGWSDAVPQTFNCVQTLPDLTASSVAPTSATVGTAATFSATISNIGNASAGGSSTLFQRATDSSGSGATTIGTGAASALAASGTTGASVSYTFLSTGTYYMRACADTASAVSESNENNNCGAWTAVNVSAAPVASVALTVTPTSITSGQSAILKWSSVNVTSCSGTNFSTSGSVNNSTGVTVSPTITTTYSISCTGSYGSASDSKIVTVSAAPQPDLTASSVAPTSATVGTAATFSATISNIGNASAGGSSTLFQRATDSSGSGATTIGTGAASALAASGTTGASVSYTFLSTGTYYMRACADTASAVSESNENNNCGAWTAVNVSAAPQPDLTASSVTPTSVAAGSATTFSATIFNFGTALAGNSLTLFQRATDSSGSGATTIGTGAVTSIVAFGNTVSSISYTFSSSEVGTKYIRACADTLGVVSESDENNNCGAWTGIALNCAATATMCTSAPNACGQTNSGTLDSCGNCSATVPATPSNLGQSCLSSPNVCGQTNAGTYQCNGNCSAITPPNSWCQPPTMTIARWGGSPASFEYFVSGQPATLSWSCPSPNISASGINYSTGGAVSGSTNVVVGASTMYTVVCDQTSAQASAQAILISPALSITANPSRVRPNNSSVLQWSANNITSCSISGPGTSVGPVAADSNGYLAPRTTTTAVITGESTYTLTCQTLGSAVSASVRVILIPAQIEI
ncbi:hypothetical protein K2Q00_02920 [Patescibacteria group bacterium]|nr:hypothetical protein [Patescibacteria group bacterium]